MATETLRPDATSANGGSTIGGGAGSRQAATSDDNDATYVQLGSSDWAFAFDEPSASVGQPIERLELRVRCARSGGSGPKLIGYFDWDGNPEGVRQGLVNVTWLTPTTIVFIIRAGAIPIDPDTFTAALRFSGTGGAGIRVYEAYLDITYAAQPTLTVTAPTGTITEDTNPVVTWEEPGGIGAVDQNAFEVKIFDDATYGGGSFDPDTSTPTVTSGVVLDDELESWVPDASLAGVNYRAYVRIGTQLFDDEIYWSDWEYSGFTMDVDRPDAPSLTLTPQDEEGRIAIEFSEGGGDATTDGVQIQRQDGDEWIDVRTLDGDGLVTEPGVVYDFEAPNGIASTYRVRAFHDYSGTFAYSEWSATASATWSSRSWWLKHPTTPELNYEIAVNELTRQPGYSRGVRQGLFQPLGADFPIAIADRRGSKTGRIVIRIDTDEGKLALDALLDATATVLLQGPISEHEPDRWIAVGDQDRERIGDKSWIEPVNDALTWTEVDRPAGAITAWPDDRPSALLTDLAEAWQLNETQGLRVGAVIGDA